MPDDTTPPRFAKPHQVAWLRRIFGNKVQDAYWVSERRAALVLCTKGDPLLIVLADQDKEVREELRGLVLPEVTADSPGWQPTLKYVDPKLRRKTAWDFLLESDPDG